MCLIRSRECILMHAYTRGGSQLRQYVIVFQLHLIIVGFRHLCGMGEGAPETTPWLAGNARVHPQLAHRRHNEEITQVRMPRTAEMRMAEPHDGPVVIL